MLNCFDVPGGEVTRQWKRLAWHVIPADHKWFSHLSTSAVLVETLEGLNPQYPRVDAAAKEALADAKNKLVDKQG